MTARLEDGRRKASFDVICAGEALWKVGERDALGLRPAGGAVDAALALSRAKLRVGLATVLREDRFGRASVRKISQLGVDVDGVTLAPLRSGLVFVDRIGGARQVVAPGEEEPALDIPERWSSQLLLLSGLSPVVSHAAALCKAARAARRWGALVVIDVNASLHVWAGRDPRTIRMVLREVDVARCSVADLAVLGMDVQSMRAALSPRAVLVRVNGAHDAIAEGAFGEVACSPRDRRDVDPHRTDADRVATMCVELLHPGAAGESVAARWHRTLARG